MKVERIGIPPPTAESEMAGAPTPGSPQRMPQPRPHLPSPVPNRMIAATWLLQTDNRGFINIGASLLSIAGYAGRVAAPIILLTAITLSPFAHLSSQTPTGHVIDLGHALASSDPTWSGKPTFERTGSSRMGRITTDEHYGTHFDAPSHGGGQLSVDLVPVERLVRPGICIALTGKPDDYQISAADVHAWEAMHGLVPEGSIVLFATGWDARWPDQLRYMNERDGVKHFPGIAVDAASYLRDRKIAGMGIDTPSVDYGPSTRFETHATTNPAGIFHIESAANLTQLPATGFTVIVAPIKIAGGSGGPTRVFAILP